MADPVPNPVFSLNLGNGVYLDSNGAVRNGPVPNAPVYEAPFTLPVDPQKIKDAISSVKDALIDINKKGALFEKFGKFDWVEKLLDLLAGIGKLASYVAPAAAAFAVVVGALKLFKILKDEDPAINKKFDELQRYMTTHFAALARLMEAQYMQTARSQIDALSTIVNNFADSANNPHWDPTPEELQFQRRTLIDAHNQHLDGFNRALALGSWLADFQRGEHTLIWPFLGTLLNVLPGVAKDDLPGTPEMLPITMPLDGPNFDHRLMFPFASFAIGTYLACIRGISPEYRTTGEFRAELIGFAEALQELANAMRRNVLARTIYTADQFKQIFYDYDGSLDIPMTLGSVDGQLTLVPIVDAIRLKPNASRWAVGAMDLRYHDDAYFSGFLSGLAASEMQAWASHTDMTAPTKLGTMDVRWMPPARFRKGSFPQSYEIANREECAAAANAQSEIDYANLLAMSGYPELLRLSALCRNQAIEPSVSETVNPGKVKLYSNPDNEAEVTVHSNPVHYTGQIITATAKRRFQEYMCKVSVQTQSVVRVNPIKYRLVLRTLNSVAGSAGWRETDYSDYQICTYENDPEHPGFQKLNISHGTGEVGVAELVADWTASPRERIRDTGKIAIKATTFDWWVPTPPEAPHDDYVDHLRGMIINPWQESRGPLGGIPDMVLTDNGFGNGTRIGPSIAELAWQRPTSPPQDGQHRDVREETVHLSYTIDWNRDQLQITVTNELGERSYVVYLVVEEQMQSSSNVLHTAITLPIDGLITRVPAQFFVDEFAAHAKTAKIIASLIPKHIPKVGEIVPNDGGVAWIQPGDLLTPDSITRVITKLQAENPSFYDAVLNELKLRDPSIFALENRFSS